MSEQTPGDDYLRKKNEAFRQALEKQEFKFVLDYAIMFSNLYIDPSRDLENASWELAEAFENTALTLKQWDTHADANKLMGKPGQADSFAARAEAMRRKLDDEELERMLATPGDIPVIFGPTDRPFELLLKDLVAATWQVAGKPPELMAWKVHISQPWRLLASYNNLVIWIFDLESPVKDERGRTGREHFMHSARNPAVIIQPVQDGKTVREQAVNRVVLKVRARQYANGAPHTILVGHYLCKLVGPLPKPQ